MTRLLAQSGGPQCEHAGAIGAVASEKYDKFRMRENTNLQFGMVAARAADMFLIASDGLWDTLDPVQSGPPQLVADRVPVPIGHLTTWQDIAHNPQASGTINELVRGHDSTLSLVAVLAGRRPYAMH